ncbi:Ctr-domain-containing protein [Conidiobolus coronatus NRRL 28638]|uniref:Copper transport protein n=1 Tax=Conidiobolus coronatus (strain ATCC 28846 / CBS 209.66 / NRRL 28638) TaxID=796925 RepID=A0A137NX26_CONC2|nr:Ctr-domain-containing protein [Conidiobolus coronatus NRRL 28638]|eukprot:KXN67248.1 Ctr-domain-containing protein [Conidiobolus coronatus NRRL 28638]
MKFYYYLSFALTALADCQQDPTSDSCANYTLDPKTVTDSLNDLCTQMPNMPGCGIGYMCGNNTSIQNQPYCSQFSQLADICATDMPKMSGCKPYVQICNAKNTKVKQCFDNPPLPSLPDTMTAQSLVKSICTEMTMDGCEKCAGSKASSCDLIGVYSQLCIAMPEMSQCSAWKGMCDAQGPNKNSFPLCQSSDSNVDAPPTMRMYFHTGFADYILFKEWVPRTGGQYAGSVIAILVMGIFYEFLLTLRSQLESRWSDQNNSKLTEYSATQFRIDISRATIQFFESLLAYALMLITMTFNVGLFFAVIAGIALGTLIFSRFRVQGYIKRACGC